MEISSDINATYDNLTITISNFSMGELDSDDTTDVDDATVKTGSFDRVDIDVEASGCVEIKLSRQEVLSLLDGEQLIDGDYGIEVIIDINCESPLDYLERTWTDIRSSASHS